MLYWLANTVQSLTSEITGTVTVYVANYNHKNLQFIRFDHLVALKWLVDSLKESLL